MHCRCDVKAHHDTEDGATLPLGAYIERVKTVLLVLVGLALAGTLGVLLAGVIGLARGGENPRRSNKLMQWRIIFQASALLLLLILMTLFRS